MIKYYEDCWRSTDDENPTERYLYVTGVNTRFGCDNKTRIVISFKGVFADDTEIFYNTAQQLDEWVEVLKKAWEIKMAQDLKGWGKK